MALYEDGGRRLLLWGKTRSGVAVSAPVQFEPTLFQVLLSLLYDTHVTFMTLVQHQNYYSHMHDDIVTWA
jgi:hypothetical protein